MTDRQLSQHPTQSLELRNPAVLDVVVRDTMRMKAVTVKRGMLVRLVRSPDRTKTGMVS